LDRQDLISGALPSRHYVGQLLVRERVAGPQTTQMDADEEFLFRICDIPRVLRAKSLLGSDQTDVWKRFNARRGAEDAEKETHFFFIYCLSLRSRRLSERFWSAVLFIFPYRFQ
jgi:hypothetical protein